MKRWKDKGQTGAWLLNSTQGPAHLQRGQWCPRWGSLPFGVEAERAMGFPRAQWYGIHLSMQELWVRSLVQEDPLEKELATHPSILAWKPPWTEKHSWTFQYSGIYSGILYGSWGREHRMWLSDWTTTEGPTHNWRWNGVGKTRVGEAWVPELLQGQINAFYNQCVCSLAKYTSSWF